LTNTGPVIDPEDRKRIFEQFYRCERSRSLVYGGAGLGLTIVKRIVELHGGTISVESDQVCTRFRVVLPQEVAG
jgi:signal transduction histidine kinase